MEFYLFICVEMRLVFRHRHIFIFYFFWYHRVYDMYSDVAACTCAQMIIINNREKRTAYPSIIDLGEKNIFSIEQARSMQTFEWTVKSFLQHFKGMYMMDGTNCRYYGRHVS